MSYQSQVLGLTNLVGFWPLDDAAGSLTAADLGPNNLPLTYSTAKPNGPQLLGGFASSLAGDGSTAFAYRTVTAGSPLQIAGSFSLGFWFQANALPSSYDYIMASRNANWGVTWKVQQFLQANPRIINGNGSNTFVNGTFAPVASQPYFVGLSWDGQEVILWVNGEFDYKTPYVGGSIAATTDRFDILSRQGANPVNGSIGGVFVANRALHAGEWKSLFLAGTTAGTLPAEGNFYDLSYDALNPSVASATIAVQRCPVCAGKMRTNEPCITDGAGLRYHAGCYGSHQQARPVTIVSSASSSTQICQDAARLIHDQTLIYATHSDAAKPRFHDGTVFHFDQSQGNGVTSTFQRSTSGVAPGMATLYRHYGLPKDHWSAALAQKIMANNISMQNSNGSFGTDGSPNAQFILQDMGEVIIFMGDTVSSQTLASWKTSFLLGCNYLQSTASYYVNGNIEIAVTYIFWLAYLVTGDYAWHTNYVNHMNFTLLPPQSGQTNKFGLYFLQTNGSYALSPANQPQQADWSDGQGFLAESGGSTPGLDYDYLQVQTDVVVRLWHMSKEPMALKLLNVLVNLALNVQNNGVNRLNTTTWTWDATGGTRHSLNTSFTSAALATLIWNNLRTDLSASIPGAQWSTRVRTDYMGAWSLNNQNYWRGIGSCLGSWIMSAPTWKPNTIPGQI